MGITSSLKTLSVLILIVGLWKVKVVLTAGSQIESSPNAPILEPADFGQLYHDVVNNTRGIIYEYRYVEVKNKTTAVRVTVNVSSEAETNFPVLFVIRQQQGILSWQIPLLLEYTTRERKNISLTSSEPQYFMYSFPVDIDSVVVEATSDDDYCMILSCPVMDQDRDVKFEGVYQTMSNKAAITIEKKNYQNDSVYIVMVLKPNDFSCNEVEKIQPAGLERKKSVTLYVYGTISAEKYWVGIAGAVAVFLLFYIMAFVIGVCYHGCDKNRGIWTFTPHDETFTQSGNTEQHARAALNPGNQGNASYGAISDTEDRSTEICKELGSVKERSVQEAASPSQTALSGDISDVSLDTDDIDFLEDADKEKDVFRTKTALYVCDLARKKMTRQNKKYTIYWRNLVALSIFYGLPVIQLVITYQKVLHITGDQDICYYNFDCAHPLGVLTAFNNVFSNIGYVMLGFLFLIIVYRRSLIYKKVRESNPIAAKRYGIPQHSGLYYAMGLGLCMEGIMSACYHVCPTYSNFQFDTSYMYIIACLCMLRIYQNRHPDISAKAHTSYLLMALVIFIAVIGVVDKGIFKRVFLMVRHEFLSCGNPVYMDRFIMLIVANGLNWAFAIYGAVTEPGDFASYLLGIFIGNLLLYSTFYIIMKIRYKERIHPLAIVCIIMACILTPANSRAGNQKCMVLDFYDAHDVWHFLSATSMFFSFLILLTLDDDLFSVRRDHIPVF
ncbi:hypothetical protein KUTeg_006331 [Tegillarca granosa]|uniref:SID1 transmembrane family member 1 n=1 Tax=Tegillarca granosa TaxID=220873 RepID=A0ABQ9FK48_TEGGR|nr:hypothetical protein KUTeg_006331 [Tegillarca granosa]